MTTSIPATVYLIHFARPFKHAKHYVGYTALESVHDRDKRHRSGDGARLLRAVMLAGINWEIVRVWEFKSINEARKKERRLKHRAATDHCPVCADRRRHENERNTKPGASARHSKRRRTIRTRRQHVDKATGRS